MQNHPVIITLSEILAFTSYGDQQLADAMEMPYVELMKLQEEFPQALFVIAWGDHVETLDYSASVSSWTFISETMTCESISAALNDYCGAAHMLMSKAVEEFTCLAVQRGER